MENIENLQDKSLEKQMIEKYISASEPRSREYGLLYSAMQYAANWQKEQMNFERDTRIEQFEEWYENLPEGETIYTEKEVKALFETYISQINASDDTQELLYENKFEEWFNQNKK